MSAAAHDELLSSVVSDIKTYVGDDALRPWVRGIRRMRQCLPLEALIEKLPRFLQKCAEAFESDRRYRDDIRYIQVWILLMDHVDDPRGVLRRMEENRIGIKHTAFYVAYALFYEKNKKFEKAEKMYHLGARNDFVAIQSGHVHRPNLNELCQHCIHAACQQNTIENRINQDMDDGVIEPVTDQSWHSVPLPSSPSEPAAELQKSYEQFLCRMKLYKKRISKLKEARGNATSKGLSDCQREINIVKDENSAGLIKAEVQIQNDIQKVKIKGTHQTSPLKGECHKKSGHTNMMRPQLNSVREACDDTKKCATSRRGKSILKTQLPSVRHKGEVTVSAGLIGSVCVSPANLRLTSDKTSSEDQSLIDDGLAKQNSFSGDDTVVVKFVGSAIVGKSEPEDACHHGLVDPTINMKEAINAINSMFREPLEPHPKLRTKSQQNRTKVDAPSTKGFEVFIDENMDEDENFIDNRKESARHNAGETALPTRCTEVEKTKPFVGTFKILADDDDDIDCAVQTALPTEHKGSENPKPFVGTFKIFADDEDESEHDFVGETETKGFAESSRPPVSHVNAPEILEPRNLPKGKRDGSGILSSEYAKLKEDTLICSFVGSTVSGEREVEDACHHGLVDPTVNLKEALHDINSMFGKPIDFVKSNRLKRKGRLPELTQAGPNFSILADEDVDLSTGPPSSSCSDESCRESDLFEPTIFTKEAMDEINKMFGKPLDF